MAGTPTIPPLIPTTITPRFITPSFHPRTNPFHTLHFPSALWTCPANPHSRPPTAPPFHPSPDGSQTPDATKWTNFLSRSTAIHHLLSPSRPPTHPSPSLDQFPGSLSTTTPSPTIVWPWLSTMPSPAPYPLATHLSLMHPLPSSRKNTSSDKNITVAPFAPLTPF